MAQTGNEEGPHMPSYLTRVIGETEAASEHESQQQEPLSHAEEKRAGDQMEGSASKGQRIIGQERWVFFQDTTMSRAQLPSSFLPGIPPDYQYQMGRNLSYSQLFLSNVIICSLMQIPLLFQLCIFLF